MRTHWSFAVRVSIWAVLISTLPLAACSDSTAPLIPARYIVTVSETTVSAGDTFVVKAQLVDAADHSVPESGRRVTWSVSGGGGQFASPQSTTGGDGVATNFFVAGSKANVTTAITVVDDKHLAGQSPSINIVAGPPSAYAVIPSETTADVGTTISITAQLTDALGNASAVAGRVLTWSLLDNGGGYSYQRGVRANRLIAPTTARRQSTTAGFSSPTSTTNNQGLATVEFAVGTTATAAYVITAKDNQSIEGTSAPIRVLSGPVARFEVTAFVTDPPAGAAVTLTASPTDSYGNQVTTVGISVNWSVTGAGGALGSATTSTNQNGNASNVLITGPTPGTIYTVTATSGSQASGTSPAITSLQQVSLSSLANGFGGLSSCGIATDGRVWCWGTQDVVLPPRPLPGNPIGNQTMSALSKSIDHACGISAGTVLCWGANDVGQLGINSRTSQSSPGPINSSLSFTAVATGSAHTCALATTGDIYCWGRSDSGRLGDGTGFTGLGPIKVAATVAFKAVTAGGAHTCAISTTGDVYCWGSNVRGEIGNGSGLEITTPTLVPGGFKFTAIASGNSHTCGVAGGVVYCWGDNSFGELGDGSTSPFESGPTSIKSTSTFATVIAGEFHTCAITVDGKVYCWGDNSTGELGDPNFSQSHANVPIAVSGGLIFKSIGAGGDGSLGSDSYYAPYATGHTCGLTTNGSAYCWGSNSNGELGIGSFTAFTATPTKVAGQP